MGSATVKMVVAITRAPTQVSVMLTMDAGTYNQRRYAWNLKMAAVVNHILIHHANGAAVMRVPDTMPTSANQKHGYCSYRIISATVKMVLAIAHVVSKTTPRRMIYLRASRRFSFIHYKSSILVTLHQVTN